MAESITGSTRYPYTYAYDLVRHYAGYGDDCNAVLSRGQAGRIVRGIADVLGLSKEELASKLADHYVANENSIAEAGAQAFAAVFKGRSF